MIFQTLTLYVPDLGSISVLAYISVFVAAYDTGTTSDVFFNKKLALYTVLLLISMRTY